MFHVPCSNALIHSPSLWNSAGVTFGVLIMVVARTVRNVAPESLYPRQAFHSNTAHTGTLILLTNVPLVRRGNILTQWVLGFRQR